MSIFLLWVLYFDFTLLLSIVTWSFEDTFSSTNILTLRQYIIRSMGIWFLLLLFLLILFTRWWLLLLISLFFIILFVVFSILLFIIYNLDWFNISFNLSIFLFIFIDHFIILLWSLLILIYVLFLIFLFMHFYILYILLLLHTFTLSLGLGKNIKGFLWLGIHCYGKSISNAYLLWEGSLNLLYYYNNSVCIIIYLWVMTCLLYM